MPENHAESDDRPEVGEPRDCCAPGRGAFLPIVLDRPTEK